MSDVSHARLSNAECKALENMDWVGLEMAARSFAKKRQLKRPRSRFSSLKERLLNLITSDCIGRELGFFLASVPIRPLKWFRLRAAQNPKNPHLKTAQRTD
jgi:hypothetical protein